VTYVWDWQPREEAAAHAVSEHDVDALRDLCARKAAGLGQGGVRGHAVGFSVTAWNEPPGLPDGISRTGCITRGDVLDIGQQVRAEARPAADLLTASFIWGWGPAGYGPRRLCRIRSRAGDQLEPALRRVLDAVSKDAAAPDPVAGYARLYGGQASQHRAAPGQEPWSRVHGLGPAFFTKFLYFCTPGALILDSKLAAAVSRLSHLPGLVAAGGRPLAWTPYRYAVYLHWMNQTAQAAQAEPELLEITLFQPPDA
jgi:hypothetical protein